MRRARILVSLLQFDVCIDFSAVWHNIVIYIYYTFMIRRCVRARVFGRGRYHVVGLNRLFKGVRTVSIVLNCFKVVSIMSARVRARVGDGYTWTEGGARGVTEYMWKNYQRRHMPRQAPGRPCVYI
jgi:hypothetical protein